MPTIAYPRRFLGQSILRLRLLSGTSPSILIGIVVLLCFQAASVAGQTSKPTASLSKPVPHHRKHKSVAKAERTPASAPAPVYPVPPAQQPPVPATVQWHDNQLSIQAKNASLVQILNEVSRHTGLKILGLSSDQRVYGNYGPGTVSRTISQLLDGSPYDYVIIGGDASHPPKQLLLTTSNGVMPTPATNNTSASGSSAEDTSNQGAQTGAPPVPGAPVSAQQMMDAYRRQHPAPVQQQQDVPPPE